MEENSFYQRCIGDSIQLGCFTNCESIDIGYTAEQDGVHVLVFNYRGQTNRTNFEAVIGENIVIPNVFNEDSVTKFWIIQPDGEKLLIDVDGTDFGFFKIKIETSNNEAAIVFEGVSDNPFTDADKAKLDELENTNLNQSITIGGNLTTQGYHTFTQTFTMSGATVPTRTIFVGTDGNLYFKNFFGSTTKIN